ncbi:MAG: methionine--tRNA ligase [Lachnospiraceae bacterium]|nr:methionine--tRNA ligase [Lachnospiraceae bacterium]
MNKNILIGGAWPYANGSLHIGHIAGLLPGDILARYYRAKGENVFYVSGSDCHGTPITIRARQESRSPKEISEYYHEEFCEVFEKLGFSYDLYTKTSHEQHIRFVQDFHRKLYESEYIEERTVKQAYCPACQKVLTDRLILGICPSCGASARGDQCDACGEVLDVDTIIGAKCAACHTTLTFRDTTQLFLCISKLKTKLSSQLVEHPYWRKNATAFTKRYIDEGLRDRAITRDLDWGIDVPKEGYNDKKIYIWAENVLGYLSTTAALCEERAIPFEEVFGENARHYYVHGKDNIPFHTIILPALLLAHGENLRLPDDIISSEYITLEGRKISTSRNWAIWAKDLVKDYNPDSIRYFFIANGPEKRDTDFSLREFTEQNNSELVGAWGNLVNRTLAFIVKYLDNQIPCPATVAESTTIQNTAITSDAKTILQPSFTLDTELSTRLVTAFDAVGTKIENGCFKDALETIFELVRFGNKYYDAQEPWKTRTTAPEKCAETLI